MGSTEHRKPLFWVGSSREDLMTFPEDVRRVMGFAFHLAQIGGRHPDAKPLSGFKGAGVLEVVDDHKGDTYRGVYTLRLAGAVYEMKSRKGIATPKSEIDLVRERLRRAEQDHEERSKGRR